MQTKRSLAPLAISLLCGMALYALPKASADDVTVQRTVITPNIYAPSTTTTTRTTTVDRSEPLTDQVIERRTVILPDSPVSGITSSSSTTVDTNALQDGRPDYARRIHNLRSQLDKAISNNWITNGEADNLNSQYMSLLSQENALRTNGYLKVDCDSIEKNLNAFNIQLSDDMARANR